MNPNQKLQLLLTLQGCSIALLLWFFVVNPTKKVLESRKSWALKNEEVQDVQRKLEDRKLLETYDETFRSELAQTIERLNPFLSNQEYLRELSQSLTKNKIELEGLEVDQLDTSVKISFSIIGRYEATLEWLHSLETHSMPLKISEWRAAPKGDLVESQVIVLLRELS